MNGSVMLENQNVRAHADYMPPTPIVTLRFVVRFTTHVSGPLKLSQPCDLPIGASLGTGAPGGIHGQASLTTNRTTLPAGNECEQAPSPLLSPNVHVKPS